MGPRSGDRGNIIAGAILAVQGLLQWGRDQVIAEISGRPHDDARLQPRFNGAAIR